MKRAKRNNSNNKIYKIVGMSLCPLLAIYLGISIFFINHFYFGSVINSISVAGKTIEEANSELSAVVDSYTLKIQGRNNTQDEINGKDIDLKYDPKGKIEELKSKQNPFLWIFSIFNKDDVEINDIVSFDKDLLKQNVEKIYNLHEDDVIEPENPTFEYTNKSYNINPEVKGTKVIEDSLYDVVEKAIIDGKPEINLDEEGCYENPKYTSDSQEVKDAKEQLDKYAALEIQYDFGNNIEKVDGSLISEWLEVDDDMNVTLNEGSVRKYVESLARKYNTYGNTRDFHATSGNIIQVSGGNYGWILNKSAQTTDLIDSIKNGESAKKEPVYSQKAISRDSNDIGNTYVEIDMTNQHLWYYKDGNLIVEGDIVTGNASLNYSTPVGTYRLNYKEKNATLKGEDYSSEVNFWMPFNNNIGIHDAGWRDKFGGNIYLTNGSHGCVNAPYEVAEKIFNNIEAGTPIVCYY